MKKRSLKKNTDFLEIGDKVGIAINFKYFYHKQNTSNKNECKEKIKEMSNKQIEKIIKNKIIKIINEWLNNLHYGTITNNTVNIKIPSVQLKIKPSHIKNINFVEVKNNNVDISANEECIYYNSKNVMILLVTKLVTNKTTNNNNLLKHYDLPNLKTVEKINDNPKK